MFLKPVCQLASVSAGLVDRLFGPGQTPVCIPVCQGWRQVSQWILEIKMNPFPVGRTLWGAKVGKALFRKPADAFSLTQKCANRMPHI